VKSGRSADGSTKFSERLSKGEKRKTEASMAQAYYVLPASNRMESRLGSRGWGVEAGESRLESRLESEVAGSGRLG
jgi:hypothetical protein